MTWVLLNFRWGHLCPVDFKWCYFLTRMDILVKASALSQSLWIGLANRFLRVEILFVFCIHTITHSVKYCIVLHCICIVFDLNNVVSKPTTWFIDLNALTIGAISHLSKRIQFLTLLGPLSLYYDWTYQTNDCRWFCRWRILDNVFLALAVFCREHTCFLFVRHLDVDACMRVSTLQVHYKYTASSTDVFCITVYTAAINWPVLYGRGNIVGCCSCVTLIYKMYPPPQKRVSRVHPQLQHGCCCSAIKTDSQNLDNFAIRGEFGKSEVFRGLLM